MQCKDVLELRLVESSNLVLVADKLRPVLGFSLLIGIATMPKPEIALIIFLNSIYLVIS